MLADDGLRDARVLVLANKQDLPGAVRPDNIVEGLKLNSVRKHQWFVQQCSATTGAGIYEGLDWLHRSLKERRSASRAAAPGA